jgi:predicted XRE-type DNA-binding protein
VRQIAELIQASGWKQVEAAERCGITQPRIDDLLRGRVSRFALDAFVNFATARSPRACRARSDLIAGFTAHRG